MASLDCAMGACITCCWTCPTQTHRYFHILYGSPAQTCCVIGPSPLGRWIPSFLALPPAGSDITAPGYSGERYLASQDAQPWYLRTSADSPRLSAVRWLQGGESWRLGFPESPQRPLRAAGTGRRHAALPCCLAVCVAPSWPRIGTSHTSLGAWVRIRRYAQMEQLSASPQQKKTPKQRDPFNNASSGAELLLAPRNDMPNPVIVYLRALRLRERLCSDSSQALISRVPSLRVS